ncbi:hypothetical protein V6R86_08400 [Sphingomonas kaistensis]|uniref:Uncharacterized protein n=1 Tax=Sphingomonas kaistensis TaxID=298708 RepID=A0ABZ2G0R9_9SPHN
MNFSSLLSDTQIVAIRNADLDGDQRHPAWPILFGTDKRPMHHLVDQMARVIATEPQPRASVQTMIDRAVAISDYTDAAAALAELRALGGLMEAGMAVRPIVAGKGRGATADFEVDAGDGPVIVEVHAKHEDGDQTARRRAIAAGETPAGVERRSTRFGDRVITSTTSVSHPGGSPDPAKPHDSVQANVISKLCAVKSSEHQQQRDLPFVLWLDLCHFGAMTHTLLEQAHPLISGHMGLTSGAIWYAFYGWKGAPILEEGSPRKVLMGHDGRFRQRGERKSRVTAVIVATDGGSFLLENPWCERRLPVQFRRRCERLPWFNLNASVADWTPKESEALVKLQEARIAKLATARLE